MQPYPPHEMRERARENRGNPIQEDRCMKTNYSHKKVHQQLNRRFIYLFAIENDITRTKTGTSHSDCICNKLNDMYQRVRVCVVVRIFITHTNTGIQVTNETGNGY